MFLGGRNEEFQCLGYYVILNVAYKPSFCFDFGEKMVQYVSNDSTDILKIYTQAKRTRIT